MPEPAGRAIFWWHSSNWEIKAIWKKLGKDAQFLLERSPSISKKPTGYEVG